MWVMATCIGSLAQTTQPKFNGDLDHFIYRNLLSTELVESNVTGAAEVEFFVETDGSLTDVKILKGDIPVLKHTCIRIGENDAKVDTWNGEWQSHSNENKHNCRVWDRETNYLSGQSFNERRRIQDSWIVYCEWQR